MSKTRRSILTSLLLGSTLALFPLSGMAKPGSAHPGLRHSLLMRFGEHRAERDAFVLRFQQG